MSLRPSAAPSACLPGCCRPCALLPGGSGGGEVRRYNENQQSVRPTDESALRTRTQSEPPRRQQQLEQQKQALWRLAQPGGRTETAEPWPTPIAFSTTLLARLFTTFRHVPKYQKKNIDIPKRRWIGELSQGNAGVRRKERREGKKALR